MDKSSNNKTIPTSKKNENDKIKRRDFLKGLATVPALGFFGYALQRKITIERTKQVSPKATHTGPLSSINVALLGVGAQGQELMNACLKGNIPGLRFAAVCDIWKDYNQKRAAGILSRYSHNVKKEMSNTLEGARRMVEAQRRTGKLLQIGHQRRSNPRYLHCYEKLIREAQLLGRITSVNGQWNRSAQPDLGWPKKYEIDPVVLRKYGYESMHQLLNWRWYKKLGGGPIVDLGSHQIDVYNWFLNTPPHSVIASGGTDYYDKKTHEWYDTVLAIYEYETKLGKVRAYYQTLTTNSSEGYFENFLGDQGTLHISESANRGGVYREASAPQWDKWVNRGYLDAPEKAGRQSINAVVDVRETIAPDRHDIPVTFNDPYHKPHLQNFFNAIRGLVSLNCSSEIGYETAVTVLKVNEAVEANNTIYFRPEEFQV